MTYEIILEQSGAPEPSIHVMGTVRRYNAAVNEVKRYADDAAENFFIHGEDSEFDEILIRDGEGNIIRRRYIEIENGRILRWRAVYFRKKVQRGNS